jgi:hypothetical protein
LAKNVGYISQTMKLGALGLPAYRTFSLEELEEATNNFDTYAFMVEGSQGQVMQICCNNTLHFIQIELFCDTLIISYKNELSQMLSEFEVSKVFSSACQRKFP